MTEFVHRLSFAYWISVSPNQVEEERESTNMKNIKRVLAGADHKKKPNRYCLYGYKVFATGLDMCTFQKKQGDEEAALLQQVVSPAKVKLHSDLRIDLEGIDIYQKPSACAFWSGDILPRIQKDLKELVFQHCNYFYQKLDVLQAAYADRFGPFSPASFEPCKDKKNTYKYGRGRYLIDDKFVKEVEKLPSLSEETEPTQTTKPTQDTKVVAPTKPTLQANQTNSICCKMQ